jgi:hypothetical protein
MSVAAGPSLGLIEMNCSMLDGVIEASGGATGIASFMRISAALWRTERRPRCDYFQETSLEVSD